MQDHRFLTTIRVTKLGGLYRPSSLGGSQTGGLSVAGGTANPCRAMVRPEIPGHPGGSRGCPLRRCRRVPVTQRQAPGCQLGARRATSSRATPPGPGRRSTAVEELNRWIPESNHSGAGGDDESAPPMLSNTFQSTAAAPEAREPPPPLPLPSPAAALPPAALAAANAAASAASAAIASARRLAAAAAAAARASKILTARTARRSRATWEKAEDLVGD